MKRNYDHIAKYYDRLSRLVFGKAQVNAQLFLLSFIPANARLLIVGGGSGWILESIAKACPAGITITYIDASAKMIELARRRNVGGNNVTFITAPIELAKINGEYDAVLSPFFFDNFATQNAAKIVDQLAGRMVENGLWLYCDFKETGVLWQKVTLKAMYLFFRLLCGIEAGTLPDMHACFSARGYHIITQSLFMNGFIGSVVYQRTFEPQKAV